MLVNGIDKAHAIRPPDTNPGFPVNREQLLLKVFSAISGFGKPGRFDHDARYSTLGALSYNRGHPRARHKNNCQIHWFRDFGNGRVTGKPFNFFISGVHRVDAAFKSPHYIFEYEMAAFGWIGGSTNNGDTLWFKEKFHESFSNALTDCLRLRSEITSFHIPHSDFRIH